MIEINEIPDWRDKYDKDLWQSTFYLSYLNINRKDKIS